MRLCLESCVACVPPVSQGMLQRPGKWSVARVVCVRCDLRFVLPTNLCTLMRLCCYRMVDALQLTVLAGENNLNSHRQQGSVSKSMLFLW